MKTKVKQTEFSGMLGEEVSVRKVNTRIVVKNRPARKLGPPTTKMLLVQQKFREASQYALDQMANEESKAQYAKRITPNARSAYFVAMQDYMKNPVVDRIETRNYHGVSGDPIMVNAVDDFMVVRVEVFIRDSSGTLLEKGEARQSARASQWIYTATVANPSLAGTTIEAIAFDNPSNEGSLVITL
ncbi:MAG: hypothetical protein JST14_00705 [Bacteroidetes bacterium]|nr:hypothetical protein [Bacteroidota bacterium]